MCVHALCNYVVKLNQNGFVKVIPLDVISFPQWSLLISKASGNTELCNVAQKCDEL